MCNFYLSDENNYIDSDEDEGISESLSKTSIQKIEYDLNVQHKYFKEFLKVEVHKYVNEAICGNYKMPRDMKIEDFLDLLLPKYSGSVIREEIFCQK